MQTFGLNFTITTTVRDEQVDVVVTKTVPTNAAGLVLLHNGQAVHTDDGIYIIFVLLNYHIN